MKGPFVLRVRSVSGSMSGLRSSLFSVSDQCLDRSSAQYKQRCPLESDLPRPSAKGRLYFDDAAQLKSGRNMEIEEIEICRIREAFESVHDEEELSFVSVTSHFYELKQSLSISSLLVYFVPACLFRPGLSISSRALPRQLHGNDSFLWIFANDL